jgi:UDP-glucose:(glucosyl)LPS alpha-1,2-glucosyltransferase
MSSDVAEVWGTDELAANALGGSELARAELFDRLTSDERNSVQIINSRVRDIDPDRPAILWLHDLAEDPENAHLEDAMMRQRFAKLIFVSYWQFSMYRARYGIRYDESLIIPHGIPSFRDDVLQTKPDRGPIRLIYHTTPHRGLALLAPAVAYLTDELNLKLHLDVYSSFSAYGWPDRDNPYLELFESIGQHKSMAYHGFQPNAVIRTALERAHIFAYPSIWPETSCRAGIEAMAAGCAVIAPNYGALPETLAPFGIQYHWNEDPERHLVVFTNALRDVLTRWKDMRPRLDNQQRVINGAFSWERRLPKWKQLIAEVTGS